jgi:hypothetical protein
MFQGRYKEGDACHKNEKEIHNKNHSEDSSQRGALVHEPDKTKQEYKCRQK